MILSSSLVTPCSGDGGLPPRWPAISSTSSMNTTACSSASISANVSRSASAWPPPPAASRDGKTSTNGHPSRDATAFANVVLPVPGGPNRTTARGGWTPYSLGQVGVVQRQHDPALDHLLLVLHAGERLPQPAGQHPAAEVAEEPDLLRLQRHDALEVRQVALLVAAVAERL